MVKGSPDQLQSIRYPYEIRLQARWTSGDVSAKYFTVAGGLYDRNYVVERLFLLNPLRRSPLSYFRFYDARLITRCLGVVQRKDDKTNYHLQRKTPDAPLACGNGLTGQIYWKSPRYKFGRWITSRWVLAHSDDNSRWSVLDGRSGRVVIPDIPNLGPLAYEDGVISDIQGHLKFLLDDASGKFTTISAFDLVDK